jgi:hypothetical protein
MLTHPTSGAAGVVGSFVRSWVGNSVGTVGSRVTGSMLGLRVTPWIIEDSAAMVSGVCGSRPCAITGAVMASIMRIQKSSTVCFIQKLPIVTTWGYRYLKFLIHLL